MSRQSNSNRRISSRRLLRTIRDVEWHMSELLTCRLSELLDAARALLGHCHEGDPDPAERDEEEPKDSCGVLAYFLALFFRHPICHDSASARAQAVSEVYRVLSEVRVHPVCLGPEIKPSAAEVTADFCDWLCFTADEHFNLGQLATAFDHAFEGPGGNTKTSTEGAQDSWPLDRGPLELLVPAFIFQAGLDPSIDFTRLGSSPYELHPHDVCFIELMRSSNEIQEAALAVRKRPLAVWLVQVIDEGAIKRAEAELEMEVVRARRLLLKKSYRVLDSSSPKRTRKQVGPLPPCWFYWQGRRHRMKGGRAFSLIQYMWGRETATMDEVIENVWPDAVLEGSVGTYITRANLCFPDGYPRRLARRGSYVTWVERT
jgi:hypothetical protein